MIRRLRVLRRMLAMNVMLTIEYRTAFLILMVSSVLVSVVSLLVWLRVLDEGVRLPYERGQLVTYYVLLSVVSIVTSTWLAEYVAEQIRTGRLSGTLTRPYPYILFHLGNNLGEKVVKLPLLLPLIAVIGYVFRDDLLLPRDPLAWILFAICLPLAAVVAFLLDFVLGSLAFWIQDVAGLIRLKYIVSSFLAGRYVPLALFPASLEPFLEAQPFRYTLSFPLEVLTGQLGPDALARGLAWQVGYCVALWAAYRVIWRYGLRAYAATGG